MTITDDYDFNTLSTFLDIIDKESAKELEKIYERDMEEHNEF